VIYIAEDRLTELVFCTGSAINQQANITTINSKPLAQVKTSCGVYFSG